MAYREHGKVPVLLGVSLRVSWSFFVCLRGSLFFSVVSGKPRPRVPDQEVRPLATSTTKAAARRRRSSMFPESSSF